jgi:diacylglycerol kinase family enzyme
MMPPAAAVPSPPHATPVDATVLPVFFSPRAGSGVEAAAIAHAGEQRGLRLAPIPLPCSEQAIAGWRARRPPLWVAGGGDGTVARVARLALEEGAELGVLPLGTRNHFAKDLGVPLELDAAVAALARGDTRRVDVGDVDGELFLNNASLGLYTRFVLRREFEERRPGPKLWPALAKAAWHALRTARDLEVTLHVDGGARTVRTPILMVGNNRYDLEGLDRGTRARLDEGVLSVHALRPRPRAALAWFGVRALFGRVCVPEDLDTWVTDTLRVAARHARTDVALDGEVRRLPAPLRFAVRPGALRVRVPAPD